MPPKKYFTLEQKRAAEAERKARKRAAERTGNPNATPKRKKLSQYVILYLHLL